MLDIIGEILWYIDDALFRRRKRRNFEKENNLPKKKMYKPLTIIFVILFSLIIIFKLITLIIKWI